MLIPLLLGTAAAVAWSVRAFKSTPFDALFVKYGSQRNVEPDLLRAIAKQESNFRPEIVSGTKVSSAGAIGLMQIMPANARAFGFTPEAMRIPEHAVDVATRLLAQDRAGLATKGRYTLRNWIATYNAGLPRVLSVGEAAAQAGYVAGVFAHYVAYKAAGTLFNRS